MCNLWLSIVYSHLLLLSSILGRDTIIVLLMAILSLVLMGELLSITTMSIGVAGMAVALTGVGILSEYGLRHLSLLHLTIIRSRIRLESKQTSSATLHRLTEPILLEYGRLLEIGNLRRTGGRVGSWITLPIGNDCRASLVGRVVCIHVRQMSRFYLRFKFIIIKT